MAFVFSRSYNSLTKFDGPLGVGWSFSFGASLIMEKEKGIIIIKDSNGLIILFEPAGENTYRAKSDDNDEVSILPSGKFERRLKGEGTQVFGADGLLEGISDEFRHSFLLIYNGERLDKIFTHSGREIDIETNGQGKITGISEPLGKKVEYQYNTNNQLISVKDIFGRLTRYFYDEENNITEIKYPNGAVEEIVYEKDTGRVLELKGHGSQGVKYEHLDNNKYQVTFQSGYQIICQDNSEKGERIVTDNAGSKDILKYDKDDQLVETRDVLGRISTFSYDKAGRMIQLVESSGRKTEYVYDGNSGEMLMEKTNGRIIRQYEYDSLGNLTGIMDETGFWTRYTYDIHGQLEFETDDRGGTRYYTYDDYGNLVQEIDTLGGISFWSYDAYARISDETDRFGNKISYEYDKNGNLACKKFSTGVKISYNYDGKGNLIKETREDGTFQLYTYDLDNKLVEKRNWEGGISRYKYNEAGELIEETNPNGSKTTYAYDLVGQLTQKTNALGGVTRLEYDRAGRLIKKVYPNGDSIEFHYDIDDNLIKKKYPDGKVSEWRYDTSGLVTESIAKGHSLINQYDTLGRLTSIEYKDSDHKAEFIYGSKGNMSQIVIDGSERLYYMYDSLDQLISIKDQDRNGIEYIYQKGRLDFSARYSNGISEEYRFDTSGDLKDMVVHLNNQPLFGFSIVRDKIGRVIERNWLSGASEKYEYDEMARLSRYYKDDSIWRRYTYDLNGNILLAERPEGKGRRTYDELDRLLSLSFDDGSLWKYQWDTNGNLTKKDGKDGMISFEYDSENKLIKISSSKGDVSRFIYDNDGRRVSVEANGKASNFLYYYENILAELDADGKIKRTYHYGYGIDNPIFFKEGGKPYFYHKDALGSIIAISNEKGEIVNRYIYMPFGGTRTKDEGIENPFQYTAREYDETFGIYFYRARFYDPSIARFISEDLLKDENLYAYVENDPVNLNDPFGLAWNMVTLAGKVRRAADKLRIPRATVGYERQITGAPNAYGITTRGPPPKITISRAGVNQGPVGLEGTMMHEREHVFQYLQDPIRSPSRLIKQARERAAYTRHFKYLVEHGGSEEVKQRVLRRMTEEGATPEMIESLQRWTARTPKPGLFGRAAGLLGRAAGVIGAAYGAFETGYAVGTLIENNTGVGKKLGIEDYEYERQMKNKKVGRQEKQNAEDLADYLKRNAGHGNLTLKPGVDPDKIKGLIEYNLNNNRRPFDGLIESPEERKAREQKEREAAYARYEAEIARQNIEKQKKEEEEEEKRKKKEEALDLEQPGGENRLEQMQNVLREIEGAKADRIRQLERALGESVTGPKGVPTGVQVQSGRTVAGDIGMSQEQAIENIRQERLELEEKQRRMQELIDIYNRSGGKVGSEWSKSWDSALSDWNRTIDRWFSDARKNRALQEEREKGGGTTGETAGGSDAGPTGGTAGSSGGTVPSGGTAGGGTEEQPPPIQGMSQEEHDRRLQAITAEWHRKASDIQNSYAPGERTPGSEWDRKTKENNNWERTEKEKLDDEYNRSWGRK